MRTALQAAFGFGGTASGDETREKREQIERELRRDERSVRFFQRLRAATARTDLNAPEVFADESFPDANIVAEYLDRADISPEIVAEYEKVCWESPEILAEIGCCFDFLTNALADAAEPPVNCRRRLYYIAWEEAAAAASENFDAVSVKTADRLEGLGNLVSLESPAASVDASPVKRAKPTKSVKSAEQKRAVREPARTVRRSSDEPRPKRDRERGERESKIAETLKAGRRAKRSRRWALAVCVLCGVATISYKTLTKNAILNESVASSSIKNEEKLNNPNAPKNGVLEFESRFVDESVAVDAPIPLCPSTVSRSDADGSEALKPKFLAEFSAETALSDVESLGMKSAATADSVVAEAPISARDAVEVAAAFNASTSGKGLDSSNLNKKPALIIPEKNNDVFAKPLRF